MSMWQILTLCAALFFNATAFAADHNLLDGQKDEKQNVCEQLLGAELAGYYVITNLETLRAALVQLRPLGTSRAYTMSSVKVNLPATAYRKLQFERLPVGWLADEKAGRRVSLMSIDRSEPKMAFRFGDPQEDASEALLGTPIEDKDSVRGNILNPESFDLELRNNGSVSKVRFTRFAFDSALENTFGMALKSLIATRLDNDEPSAVDFVFSVEMKRPMTVAEACSLLGNEAVCGFERDDNPDQLYYKFAVAENLYQFLEDSSRWIRVWEVDRIDVMPVTALSEKMASRVIDRLKSIRPIPADNTAAPASSAAPVTTPAARPASTSVSRQPAGGSLGLRPASEPGALSSLRRQGSSPGPGVRPATPATESGGNAELDADVAASLERDLENMTFDTDKDK